MEGAAGTVGATKRVLVVTMLLLLAVVVVVVQAHHEDQVSPPYPTFPKQEKFLSCAKKCVDTCSLKLKEGPIQYSVCLGRCLLRCKQYSHQNTLVYDCTEKCLVSKATIFKPPPELYDEVESYVDSCYDGCWNKNTVGHGF